MRTIEKIGVSIALVTPIPLLFYISITDKFSGRMLLGSITLVVLLCCLWIRKKVILGKIDKIEIKMIDEQGTPISTVGVLTAKEIEIVIRIFNKNAEVFIEEEFEYSNYAIYIYTDKQKIIKLYPDKKEQYKVKINKHILGVYLSEKDAKELNCVAEKYI